MARLGFGATFKLHNGTALILSGEVLEVKPSNLEGEAVETTHHGSSGGVREYIAGLLTPSEFEVMINVNPGDATHVLLVGQVSARTLRAYEMTVPNATTGWKFSGNCIPLKFEIDSVAPDGVITGKLTAQPSGSQTEAAAA